MCMCVINSTRNYIGIYLTKELKNDLQNRWYHRVGDTDAGKQRMEVELIEMKITKIECVMIVVFLTIVWFGWGQFQF